MSAETVLLIPPSRLQREREALVRMVERLEMYAAHAEGCKGDEFCIHQCTCGMSQALDAAANLCEGIREGWK